MRRVLLVAGILAASCFCAKASTAGEDTIEVRLGEVSSALFEGTSVSLITLSIPESVLSQQFVQCRLELRVGPESVEDAYEVKEVQVAEFVNGSIVLPPGKARPVSILCLKPDASGISINVDQILRPRFGSQADGASLTLAIGDLSPSDGVGSREITPCCPEEGVWCRMILKYEG